MQKLKAFCEYFACPLSQRLARREPAGPDPSAPTPGVGRSVVPNFFAGRLLQTPPPGDPRRKRKESDTPSLKNRPSPFLPVWFVVPVPAPQGGGGRVARRWCRSRREPSLGSGWGRRVFHGHEEGKYGASSGAETPNPPKITVGGALNESYRLTLTTFVPENVHVLRVTRGIARRFSSMQDYRSACVRYI